MKTYTQSILCLSLALGCVLPVFGQSQAPKYSRKYFVSHLDTTVFKNSGDNKNGRVVSYIVTSPEVWDVDDNNTTHVRGGAGPAVIRIEGDYVNGNREGVFSFYILDSFNRSKSYKIWDQDFKNNRLNGRWNVYNLRGTLISFQTFSNDSLDGISRNYWIDGKKIMDEREFKKGSKISVARQFFDSGKLAAEVTIENQKINGTATEYYESGKVRKIMQVKDGVNEGPGKLYYETGIIQEEVNFIAGEFHGLRKYFHPNGQLWIEQEFKNGLHWNVIANFDSKGNKKNPGTLKNGNGTILRYSPTGELEETITIVNGKEQN